MSGRSERGLTKKLSITICIICLGSLQFGYHMAELNSPEAILSCRLSKPGSVPYDETWFGKHGLVQCIPLRLEQIGLVTSIFSIGGLLGSLNLGPVADRIGRKRASLINSSLYLVGSMLNGSSNNYTSLLIGRFIAGLGAGGALVITSLFINEISPSEYKGSLGSMNQASVNVGILLTQILALFWANNNNWRLLLFTGAFLAICNFLLTIFHVEESPVWLLNKGHHSKAFRVLHSLRGGEYIHSRNEVLSWQGSSNASEEDEGLLNSGSEENNGATGSQEETNAVSLRFYLTSPEFYNSRLVATGILVLQQFCGINSIIFYGVSVLIAIFPTKAVFINFLISSVNVLFTFIAAPLIDKLGRKPLLLISVMFMGILTAVIGAGIITASALLSIIGIFTYITFFALGLGPIPFLIVSEVTQPKAKASAQSWGMTMNWLATFVVGFLFPILKNSSIGGGVYFIFTVLCALTFMFILKFIPETKGKGSYEEVWAHDNRLD